MARSRYIITEVDKPHFLTCTIVEWLPLFTRSALVDIVLDTWRFQQANQGLKLYGYVVLENHLHYLAQSSDLAKSVAGFKSFTARKIIDHLEAARAESTLQRLRFAKRAHKTALCCSTGCGLPKWRSPGVTNARYIPRPRPRSARTPGAAVSMCSINMIGNSCAEARIRT